MRSSWFGACFGVVWIASACAVQPGVSDFASGGSSDTTDTAVGTTTSGQTTAPATGIDDTTGPGTSGPPDDGSSGPGGSTGDDAPGSGCGNGFLDEGEGCDTSEFGGQTCADFGFDGGMLTCGVNCNILTEMCIGCGNNLVEADEVCDGNDLGGETCEGLGFASGSLTCADDCSALQTDGCVPAVCGDGMLNGDEVCDDVDFGGATCESMGDFVGGDLTCAADCASISTENCVAPVCGDGMANGSEACDANDLGGDTCQTVGFDAGALACNGDCTHDTSGCLICAQFGEACQTDADCCPGYSCDAFFGNTCWP